MAAEFRVTVDLVLEKKEIKDLISLLRQKSDKCIQEVQKIYQNDQRIQNQLLGECKRDLNSFNQYLTAYKQQWIDNGTNICYDKLRELNYNDEEYKKMKKFCLESQLSGIIVFQQNVIQKLQSYQ